MDLKMSPKIEYIKLCLDELDLYFNDYMIVWSLLSNDRLYIDTNRS